MKPEGASLLGLVVIVFGRMDTDVTLLAKIPEFREYITELGSLGIFIWFITFNQINPIPAEFSMLLIGYLVAQHAFNPILAGVAAVAGNVAVDVLYYYLSKTGSKLISKKTKKFGSSFLNSYKKKLKNNMAMTLIVLCFIPRMRMFGPILVGGMKASFGKFLLFDTIGVVLFTAVYIALGVAFHKSLASIFGKVKYLQNIIFIAALVIIAVIVIVLIRRRKK